MPRRRVAFRCHSGAPSAVAVRQPLQQIHAVNDRKIDQNRVVWKEECGHGSEIQSLDKIINTHFGRRGHINFQCIGIDAEHPRERFLAEGPRLDPLDVRLLEGEGEPTLGGRVHTQGDLVLWRSSALRRDRGAADRDSHGRGGDVRPSDEGTLAGQRQQVLPELFAFLLGDVKIQNLPDR